MKQEADLLIRTKGSHIAKVPNQDRTIGKVASLHLHPEEAGAPLQAVDAIQVVESMGILGSARYYGRRHRLTGKLSRRQVSLIEREQIAEHAAVLGLIHIPPGAVRANIETTELDLISLIGTRIEIGEAVLFLYEAREPCAKMDAVCQGLRNLMLNQRQGVLAEVVVSGKISIGDLIYPCASLRKSSWPTK
jgi:MOSC domain-containing protein YiiM